MADIEFLGLVGSVQQVTTVQITADDAATTYTITIGAGNRTHDVSVAGSGTGVNQTATDLQTACDASTHPYFSPLTFTVATDTITITGVGSRPFTAASSVTGGTGTIGAPSTTTSPTGPHHYDDADNWSGGAVPVASDTVRAMRAGTRILYGLDDSAISLAKFQQGNDVVIGLRDDQVATSEDGETHSADAPEYLDTYLQIKATTVELGVDFSGVSTAGSGRINIDNSIVTASVTTIDRNSSTSKNGTLPSCLLKFADADADVFVRNAPGGVGIGLLPAETFTVGEINVDDQSANSRVLVGDGVTMTAWRQLGGSNEVRSAATVATFRVDGGGVRTVGAWKITTATVTGGTWQPDNKDGSSIIADTLTQSGGLVDTWKSSEARTFTTYNFDLGTRRIDDRYITITNDNRTGRFVEEIDS